MDLPFSTEDLARLYRFALLITGDETVAQQVFYDACIDGAPRLGSYRNEDGRMAYMLGAMRQKAKTAPPGAGRGIVRAFATLPEEERVALAGLYTGLLPARALAEALKLSLDDMGAVLKSARERLGRSGEASLLEQTPEQAL